MTDTGQSKAALADDVKSSKKALVLGLLALVLLLSALVGTWLIKRPNTHAAASHGSLIITADPQHAKVFLDGKIQGQSPLTLNNLQLGHAYRLSLSASGFQTHHANLYLDQKRPDMEQHIVLQALVKDRKASLQVETKPAGARIFLDNQNTAKLSPALIANLAPGLEHEIRVSLDGYKDERRRFMPRAGEQTLVELQLEKRPQQKTKPATRRRRAQTAEASPPQKNPTPPVKKTGFGFLNLRTEPWTQVFDGPLELGETPLFKVKLSAGKHRLRVRNKSKKIDRIVVVTIKKDKITTLSKKLLDTNKPAH